MTQTDFLNYITFVQDDIFHKKLTKYFHKKFTYPEICLTSLGGCQGYRRRNNMAARKTVKKPDKTTILPPLTSNYVRPKQKSGKKLGNFGAYILLPSLDPVQNMNAIYDVRMFCKRLCERYLAWKVWQREVLLCSLSEKCSVNLLTSLSTILEPVFHRDFVSRLHGRYPDFQPKILCVKKRLKRVNKSIDVEVEIDKKTLDNVNDKSMVDNVKYDEGNEISTEQVEASIGEQLDDNNRLPLTDLIKESLVKADKEARNITNATTCEADKCRSCHVHTANIYNQDTGTRFFSASRFKRLSEMKANCSHKSRSELGPRISELDQKCFKHRRWWSADPKEKRLVPAKGLSLWKYFSRQLNEVNERMVACGDHERVHIISEVIKSSDPEQINFFAQCLIQRLKDHTDLSILPDQTLLKIFSTLDAKTLCQISQVSKRWRYLAEDGELWRNKCRQLGLSNGVNDLIVLIEKSAENHTIDWKQAYQEVLKLFQRSTQQNESQVKIQEDEDIEEPVEPTNASSESQITQITSENDEISEQELSTTTADIQVEYFDLTPVSDGDVASGPSSPVDDLVGGNMTMLEDVLSELGDDGKQKVEVHEEIAYDIRPNKIQPLNEMEDFENGNHQLVTVGVHDVKSVKRVRKLQGHMDGVYTVQFDLKRCLTGSADRILRMWDVRTGRSIRTMIGHLGGVRCAQFDNEKILSGSWDTTIMIWDVVKFTCIRILRGHQGCVSCLRFNSKYLASGSHDMTVRIWDVDTWECLRVLEGHTGEVTCLFQGRRVLLTGSTDKTIKLWNVESGECVKTLLGHNSSVLAVQVCRALVISGSEEGKVMFWDIEQESPVAIIQAHDGPCNCLYVWGSHFLSGGGDALVKQWDISTMTCLRTLQGHNGPVQAVKMNWSKIISSSEDGTVRIWDLEAPVHKLHRQYNKLENSLLPFDTLEQDDNEPYRMP
ncbi:F-box/WD repeat-containing protein 7-like isoform X2 [Dendronephthya gigantea]|uniref:F-box/WD repeat-containing protein 7-like isoform X2 n=1 Tax=Dendronephthya gigantea TaxID=151771 RepID=UPI00106CB3B5|nr:F-box/WD repeat-containing protein 7-like isoform X2 [Dendronephthya gigantea]